MTEPTAPGSGTAVPPAEPEHEEYAGFDRRGDRSERRRYARSLRERRRQTFGAFLRELPVLIVVAFLLAYLLRTFAVQVFYIPSSSMEPALQVGDRIIVEKVSYRFREPRRGEIIVFGPDDDFVAPGGDANPVLGALRRVGKLIGVVPTSTRDFVKRLVALPGDEVRVDENGVVFVNGVALDEPYVLARDLRSFGPIVVPDGELFFLGDNRPNSQDSRDPSVGFIERDRVVGRVVLVIWPPGHFHLVRAADHEQTLGEAGPSGELGTARAVGEDPRWVPVAA